MQAEKFIKTILNLKKGQALAIHNALYNTPEGQQALEILKGYTEGLEVEQPKPEKEEKPKEPAAEV